MFDNSGQLLFPLLHKRTILVYYHCFTDNYRSGGLFKVTQSIPFKAMPGMHLWHWELEVTNFPLPGGVSNHKMERHSIHRLHPLLQAVMSDNHLTK